MQLILLLFILGICQAVNESFFWKSGEHYVKKYSKFDNKCWKALFIRFSDLCKMDVNEIPGVRFFYFYFENKFCI